MDGGQSPWPRKYCSYANVRSFAFLHWFVFVVSRRRSRKGPCWDGLVANGARQMSDGEQLLHLTVADTSWLASVGLVKMLNRAN